MGNDTFCSNLMNRYFECIRINIQVFDKERGIIMCDHIKNYIDNSICEKNDDNINEFINKISEKVISIKKLNK